MKVIIADIETNGLLDVYKPTETAMDRIHCIVTRDNLGKVSCFHDSPAITPRAGSLEDGVRLIEEADLVIGHNWQEFDARAIKKVFPWFKPRGRVLDTIIASRLIWPEIKDSDMARVKRGGTFPMRFAGQHGLKAWGHRLGVYKSDFGETSDWKVFTQQMLDYCVQDTRVTVALAEKILELKYAPAALELEHEFAAILGEQERNGFMFDDAGAQQLQHTLLARRVEIDAEVTTMVQNFLHSYETEVKKIKKTKTIVFNPNSRDHIAKHLMERRGWKPKLLTEGEGKPQIDESVLEPLPWPEAKLLNERFMVQKRLGQLCEGKVAWTKLRGKDGRIHGRVSHNGARTGRCTHSTPNMAQVPRVSVGKDKQILRGAAGGYGWECRSLFRARPGMVLVGGDAQGLELRMFAHFLAAYDGGAYVHVVTQGDVHETNRIAAGLDTRDKAKTFIYATLYGAGDEKIGTITGGGSKQGKLLKARFETNTPGFAALKLGIRKAVAERGWLRGLDGRQLSVPSQHSALNTLLQSAGALVMKQATILLHRAMLAKGWVNGLDYAQVAHIHDEVQLECKPSLAPELGAMLVQAIKDAGTHFKLRCPLDGAFKIGATWAETH